MRLWAAVQSQWRYAGMAGVPTGLDYAGCRAVADALGVDWGAVLPSLQVMEREWLAARADAQAA